MLVFAVWLPTLSRGDRLRVTAARLLVLLLAVFTLLKAQSAASLVVAGAVLTWFIVRRIPVPLAVKVGVVSTAVASGALYFDNFSRRSPVEVGLQTVHRDTTLTGRTELWRAMIEVAKQHPVWGLGFNAFWVDESRGNVISRRFSWSVFQGHNGYIDIFNELGMVGSAIFALFLFTALTRTYRRGVETFFLIVLGVALHNLVESSFCRQLHVCWVAFLIALIASIPLTRYVSADRLSPRRGGRSRLSEVPAVG